MSEDPVTKEWDKRADEIKKETQIQSALEDLHEELNPRRHFLHKFFILFSVITGLIALNMGFGQLIGIAFEQVDPIQYVLRIYVIVLCVLVIFNELEWTSFLTSSRILTNWVSRGIVYAFIGVLGLEENQVSPANKNETLAGRTAALMYIKVVAWGIIVCGILYFVMGLLCMQIICNRMRENYKRRRLNAREKRKKGYTESPEFLPVVSGGGGGNSNNTDNSVV